MNTPQATMFTVITRVKEENKITLNGALSFAVPRKGCECAARMTFLYYKMGEKKPINVWSGIVSEKTFVRLHDARCGLFGFVRAALRQKGVINGIR